MAADAIPATKDRPGRIVIRPRPQKQTNKTAGLANIASINLFSGQLRTLLQSTNVKYDSNLESGAEYHIAKRYFDNFNTDMHRIPTQHLKFFENTISYIQRAIESMPWQVYTINEVKTNLAEAITKKSELNDEIAKAFRNITKYNKLITNKSEVELQKEQVDKKLVEISTKMSELSQIIERIEKEVTASVSVSVGGNIQYKYSTAKRSSRRDNKNRSTRKALR